MDTLLTWPFLIQMLHRWFQNEFEEMMSCL